VKALRNLFPIKDGDIFSKEKVAKGLENLRKAYGELGYINFTSVPETRFEDDKKLIFLDIDVDEGKQFYVRRIEFQGNTTTRDKVIRREIALEEGNIYNSRLWELSLLRLNQLGYFDQLKPDDPNVTDRKLDEKDGLVDLTLKVKEKGKNSIGLNGGVSGLEGAFRRHQLLRPTIFSAWVKRFRYRPASETWLGACGLASLSLTCLTGRCSSASTCI
jgi:outer membrane protein insertion porin family